MNELHLDLSGVSVVVTGLPGAVASRFVHNWGAFVAPVTISDPFLVLALSVRESSRPAESFQPKAMVAEFDANGARFWMPEGEVRVGRDGQAQGWIAAMDDDRRYFTAVNLLRASLAFRLPDRGGALVHGAGLVVGGRAFALVGSQGAGKSTWARLGAQGGALVLSDDLLLIDGFGGRISAVGAPFRSTYRGPLTPPGRWPLAAWLFPLHGVPAALAPVPSLLRRARLVANLPFVAEALQSDARIGATVESLVSAIPAADLRFGLDDGFLTLLSEWDRHLPALECRSRR